MRDVPLGTLIFRAGLLAEEQLEDALQEGMRTGKRLGEVLAERGLIRDSDLGRLLAGQQGLPFVEVATLSADPEAVRMLPDNIARMQNAFAFAVEEGVPVVAVADPTNELVIENVRRALGTEPRLVVAAHGELAKKINEVYSAPAPVAPSVEAAPAPAPAPAEAPTAAPAAELPAETVQPASAPVPTPMPTVMPPAEERIPEPEPEPVAGTATAEVPPLHAQASEQPPLAPEPMTAPVPAAEQPAAPAQAQPVEPAQVEVQPVAPPVVEHQPAEPVMVVAEPVVPAEPVVTAEPETTSAPAETGMFVQAAEQALAPVAEQPTAPAPEPTPAADPTPVDPVATAAEPEAPQEHTVQENGTTPAAVPTHFVVLRLAQDEHLEIGGFATQEEAESFARTVVGRIGRAEEQGEWPSFSGRFLRPQTIISVDVVDHSGSKWMGSESRARWAQPQPGA
jgi:hypothetical protein